MVASELTVRLSEHFGAYIACDPALLTEATSICKHYGVTPEDLFYKWEAFAINNHLPKSEPLTIDHARELRKIIAAAVNANAAASVAGGGGEHAQTPLKPSSALNRGRIAGDFTAMLGIKSTPNKTAPASNVGSVFQTPVRSASASINSPFGGPGATPASASAYKPTSAGVRDADVHMSDIDSPLRPANNNTSASTSKHAQFSILESLNEHIPLTGSGSQLAASSGKKTSRVSLAMATDPKAWNYRYMFEKKGERSQVLDDRIDDYAGILRSAYSIDESEELGDPSLPSQEPIWVVGRVCPALPAPESSAGQTLRAKFASRSKTTDNTDDAVAFGLPKLSETGLVLESSRMMGSGNRTPIHFNKGCIVRHTPQDPGTGGAATTLSLFPGQIVLCKGINAGADKFSIDEICFPPPLPLAVHTVEEAMDHSYAKHKLDGRPMNIVAACGPFTDEGDLEFKPWHRFMDSLESGGLPFSELDATRRGVPDTLILMGPFISVKHAKLAFSDEMPAEMFKRHFGTRLERLGEKYPGMGVVVVSSTEDVLNVHASYPQPGFGKEEVEGMGLKRKGVRCLPNPSVFYINELVVGVTTVDSLGDVKSEEMVTRIEAAAAQTGTVGESVASKNKETNTRWSRSILSQRTFYPVFPPPTTSGLSYDTSHSHLLQFPAVTPDLLVLPSRKTKPFIRVVNSATVVQPGSVAETGSVVCIQVAALPRDELEGRDEMESINARLWDRARVDVIAI
ncbi:alpha DNA polymerase [Pseudozyma hubeiensis SY62]|uniref:DNA polymerase alpha subunit B n=1 Tax=Pseudozyma hubeiensis (strain SY62) TaxID=1305764 RepID=R9NZ19_PSEHS|nr:alpha DNA polymerase [Pseudozyma hubeiensis SY62]GAC94088.1 alpha DNA polymerase [Pseudozyma hubeiensis SY62]